MAAGALTTVSLAAETLRAEAGERVTINVATP